MMFTISLIYICLVSSESYLLYLLITTLGLRLHPLSWVVIDYKSQITMHYLFLFEGGSGSESSYIQAGETVVMRGLL